MKKFKKFVFENVQTIITVIGISVLSIGLFTINLTIGFIGTGVLLTLLGLYVDRQLSRE